MKLLHPIRLLAVSFIIWISFYFTIPSTYLYEGSALFGLSVLGFYLIFFLLGFYTKKGVTSLNTTKKSHPRKLKQIVLFLFLLGGIGVLIKIYTGLFITKIFLSSNIAGTREELFGQEFSGGVSGIVGAMLFPFAVVAMLLTIHSIKQFNKVFVFVVVLLGCYPLVETYFMGGRTIIVLLGMTILITVLLSLERNNLVKSTRVKLNGEKLFSYPSFLNKKWIWVFLVLGGFLFVRYSVNVISSRLAVFDYEDTLEVWEGIHGVDIDDSFKKQVKRKEKKAQDMAIGLYSLKHYFAHGMFEYIRLVNHLEKSYGYYYGMYEFHVFFKFFRAFGLPIPSFDELNEVSYKKAVYTTFWGPFYIDFGVLGIFVMYFWGRFVKKVYTRAKLGDSRYAIFYAYLAVIILASFFLNFLLGSSSYYLFGFLVTIFLFKIWPNNLLGGLNRRTS